MFASLQQRFRQDTEEFLGLISKHIPETADISNWLSNKPRRITAKRAVANLWVLREISASVRGVGF
jgi:hypothetical protein